MLQAPVFADLDWLIHGFGRRDSVYPADICLPRQIHSKIVLDHDRWSPGVEADAVISSEPGVVVGVKTADCVPILLADPQTRAVAAVHAGWRGAAEHIVVETVAQMTRERGVRARDLRAAVGPSIGICCYEVGTEVAARFGIECVKNVHLDLPAENARQLQQAGVREIWIAGECTFCLGYRYFSFRRERESAGRMVSYIGRTA